MKTPGPDHPITLTPAPQRMQAKVGGRVIADSAAAILLAEASYKPVAYFPRADVEMALFTKTARKTVCPYKGEASYYTVTLDGTARDNMVWSYEDPYPAMAAIKGLIAFYPDQAEVSAAD
jgi:uncharacterized protein (DUF427 family)